jgi:hypothetical protein
VSWGGGATLTSVTDDQGNTYNTSSLLDVPSSQWFAIFWLGNVTNAPTTITATFSGTNFFQAMIWDEYSGIAALTDPSDGHVGQVQASVAATTDAITSTGITTTVDGDLIYGATMSDSGIIPSAGTGFTARESGNAAGAGVAAMTEDLVQTTAGSVAATFTSGTAGQPWVTFVLALKAAGGSPVAFVSPLLGMRRNFPISMGPFKSHFSPIPAAIIAPVINPVTLSVTTGSSVAITRQVGKLTPISSASAIALVKAASKSLSVSTSSAVSALAIRVKLVLVSVVTSSAVSRTLVVSKLVPVATTSAVSAIKATAKLLAVSTTSAVSVVANRLKNVLVNITTTSTVTISALKARLVSLTISTTSTVAHTLTVGKQIAISSTSAVFVAKAIAKTLAVASTSTVLATRARTSFVAIAVATSSAVAHTLVVSKRLGVATSSAIVMVRQIGKKLAISTASLVSALAGRIHPMIMSISTASTVSVSKSIGKRLSVTVLSTVSTVVLFIFNTVTSRFARRVISRSTNRVTIIGRPDKTTITGRPANRVTIIGKPGSDTS